MATPHVAGAFAVLRSKVPTASVDTLLDALRDTGVSITDPANGIAKPRIQIDAALNVLGPNGDGHLQITPETGLTASGHTGGPFTPTSQTYRLTNPGSTAINFTVNDNASWASVSPTSGSLDPGASTDVVVSFNSSANTLTAGSYTGTVTFTNTTNTIGSTSRSLNLSLTPSNDNFQDATVLSGNSVTTTGSNVGATSETGEPNWGSYFSGYHSVWWRWTAPATGSVAIDTFGSSFHTLLAVYTGTQVSALTQVVDAGINVSPTPGQSRVSFRASAGTTYYLAVDGYRGATGSIVLHLTLQ